MSLLSKSLQVKANIPARLYPIDAPFQFINGMLVPYADNPKNYIVNGYNVNDVIYSIIKLIVDKVKVAPWGLYKVEDESAYKQLQAIKAKKNLSARDYVTSLSLQKKALMPVSNPGKWGELLNYPNERETWCELIAEGATYKLITGNKYYWGELISAGANAGAPRRIKTFPAHLTQIYAAGQFPDEIIKGYGISEIPKSFYKPEEILHEKYVNPNWSLTHDQLYGMSPLKVALLRLKKSNSLTQAEASTFQNEGIKGLMHMKGQIGQVDGGDLLKEVKRLKETMIQEWVGPSNRGRIGLSGYDVGYIPIGLTSEEMQMIETAQFDLRQFCNLYGVPSQLLNDPINKTYNTYKESERALTSRCALPELKSTADSFNRKGEVWGIKKGQVIDFDMSVFPELQSDVKETSEWLKNVTVISPNEEREMLALAALPNPEMSDPWVMQNGSRVPLKDFMMQNDVDDALNQEEQEPVDNSEDEEKVKSNGHFKLV